MPRLTPLKSADVCRKLRKIDDAYVVSFPEFPGAHTHGATYLEAARQGQTVLGRLIDACERAGQRLPAPVYYAPVTASPGYGTPIRSLPASVVVLFPHPPAATFR